ncbi:MAG: response regulator [Spirochaetales bacterium]|nr:response regulator [Spirochaetales bacterium]
MPVMDCYESTKEIRALDNPAFRSLPIVALTANAFKEDEQHALEAVLKAHISKPFDVYNIMAVINEQLTKK